MQQELQMPERKNAGNLVIISIIFVLSRIIFYMIGVRFEMGALADYWHYPEIAALKQDVFKNIWYQPAQPPLFNFLVAGILKTGGIYASHLFVTVFMAFSLINAFLLNNIIFKLTTNRKIALILTLVYLLSPATILFENELFYTSFITLLFLLCTYNLVLLQRRFSFSKASLVFFMLAAICLTRSFYHLGFMAIIAVLLSIHWWPSPGCRKLLLAAVLPLCLVTGWYARNYVLFGKFSTTSWGGMSLARIVFKNNIVTDSSSIASIPPFSRVSAYSKYIQPPDTSFIPKDRLPVLTAEYKNGAHLNLFNLHYLNIADQYAAEAKRAIKHNPVPYLKNVATSAIIFFTPASAYFQLEKNERIVRYYDAAFSLNFSSFFTPVLQQKQSLVLSALVIFMTWVIVLNSFRKEMFGPWQFPAINFFILITLVYVFVTGSLLEYGENMRFRYEVQPLFLILAGQYINWVKMRRTIPSFQI